MSKFPIDSLLKSVNKFIYREPTGAIILLASGIIAIICVNAYVVTEINYDILLVLLVSGISGVIFLKSASQTAKLLSFAQ